MTLPASNATYPSEPQNFAVTALNGTIVATWSDPVVRPHMTRFQLIRAPGSASAIASGFVVWEGDTNQAIYATQSYSDAWYHVRAYVNSDFSNYVPNTFGVHGRPLIDPSGALGNRALPDGDFSFALNTYWQLPISNVFSLDTGNGMGFKGSITLTGTQGFLSGNQQRMRGVVPNLDPTPDRPKLTPGQTVAITLSVMRVESDATDFILECLARHYVSKTSNTELTMVNTDIRVSSQTVGEWRTYNFVTTAPTSPVTHMELGLAWYSAYGTAGRTRIGVLQAGLL